MQCSDVVRQLAVGTDEHDHAALAEHLAGCAACSLWAEHVLQLDRLWEATRAPDPAPDAWEAVWDRIVESLDSSHPNRVEHSAAPAVSRNGSTSRFGASVIQPSSSSSYRRRPFAAIVGFGLAQAAAVLLAVGLVWHSIPSFQKPHSIKRPNPSITSPPSVDAALLPIEIDEGNLVVIRSEGEKPEVLIFESSPFGFDEWLPMLNFAESVAPNSVVAMKE
jgi:hypothetical protein